MEGFLFKRECYRIIGCCMEVHKYLGPGLLEAVYQEALAMELKQNKIPFAQEVELQIDYKGVILNKKYKADLICFNEIIVELKAVKELDDIHYSQLINYLKITNKKVGLLINFGSESLEFKRFIN
ncbi:GxxExxY protein [Carboxylicivirga caseinilyticus]|uniref:GxxExxY protein n=1 Tax=Carboxylicivirga caseinilyticus TaxID=3417572 RepID=UPI003D332122|nr:GxxExxY protein [Marinilabiliaceae bacterium A049]